MAKIRKRENPVTLRGKTEATRSPDFETRKTQLKIPMVLKCNLKRRIRERCRAVALLVIPYFYRSRDGEELMQPRARKNSEMSRVTVRNNGGQSEFYSRRSKGKKFPRTYARVRACRSAVCALQRRTLYAPRKEIPLKTHRDP